MFCVERTRKSATEPVTSELLWALMRDPETKRKILKYRRTGDAWSKSSLPGFVFQAARFDDSDKDGVKAAWRLQEHVVLNGLCMIDMDHVGNPKQLIDGWLNRGEEWLRQQGIVMIFITPSGDGAKAVFIARPEWGNLAGNQLHMAEILGVESDKSTIDSSRLAFIPMAEEVKYIDEERLLNYDNPEYEALYGEAYRQGNTAATAGGDKGKSRPDDKADKVVNIEDLELGEFCGVPIQQIVDAWVGSEQPKETQRHKTSLCLADELRYITSCDAEWIERILRAQPWVQDIVELRNENVAGTVKSALKYAETKTLPKRMMEALAKCGITKDDYLRETLATIENEESATALNRQQQNRNPLRDLPYTEWERQIKAMWRYYPPLKAVCQGLCSNQHQWPAALFATGHCGVNLMTRCTYHHYFQPWRERRLNSDVHIIGDPATGKSFVGDIYERLMKPILDEDKKAIDLLADYKIQQQGRSTSTKEQKKDAITRPKVVKRDHDSRTSNAEFIMDHLNAREIVDGREMQLHLTTFDSELDNTTSMQRGGGWIDKKFFELKAFHNEKDGQQYANKDSVPVTMYIHYNLLFTGTPLALYRKVNERNFGDGLATRLAVIPLPPSNFEMVELMPEQFDNSKQMQVLDEFARRLDRRHGELPIRQLIVQAYNWTKDRMEIAKFNDDHADEMLIKRCCYYGIAMAVPFIDDRHKEELESTGTYKLDRTDLKLCQLVLDMQYRTQHYWFYELARNYFDNQSSGGYQDRQRRSKYDMCFERLPQEFSYEQFATIYGYTAEQEQSGRKMLSRLKQNGRVAPGKGGQYTKKSMVA